VANLLACILGIVIFNIINLLTMMVVQVIMKGNVVVVVVAAALSSTPGILIVVTSYRSFAASDGLTVQVNWSYPVHVLHLLLLE
jgi:hypothetical protein